MHSDLISSLSELSVSWFPVASDCKPHVKSWPRGLFVDVLGPTFWGPGPAPRSVIPCTRLEAIRRQISGCPTPKALGTSKL